MNYDELKRRVLELVPGAMFDVEYRSGEVMISTGLVVGEDGILREVVDVLGES